MRLPAADDGSVGALVCLKRYKLFFLALASWAAPIIGKIFELCPRWDVMLRVTLCGIIDISAGAFITAVAETYGVKLIVFCHFRFLLKVFCFLFSPNNATLVPWALAHAVSGLLSLCDE